MTKGFQLAVVLEDGSYGGGALGVAGEVAAV